MASFIKYLLLSGLALLLPVLPAAAGVQYVDTMPPAQIPQITYWFWHSNSLANAQYLNDVQSLATNSPYTLAILTARPLSDSPESEVDFYDYKRLHEPFAETVRAAHQKNLKVGLQIWEFWSLMRTNDWKLRPQLPVSQAMALVTEGQVVLDAHGHADYSVTATEGRDRLPFHSEVLKAFAFRPTGDGYYAEGSLTDLTASVKTVHAEPASLTLAIDAPTNLAGDTVYVMAAHYYDYPDLFNDVMTATFREILEHYADIPFDGTALDEFGWMMLKPKRDHPFRDRIYGRAFAAEYLKRTGTPLERALFDMRFAPAGKPEVRIRAINEYFDVMRDGPLRAEQAFYKMSKEIFGPNTFAGIHNTYHNGTRSDDLWRVGLNWWSVPREYGQSDENWGMPQRMGLLVAHPKPITFDQYYGGILDNFLKKAFQESRFGGRTDYLAWNDTRAGRINMADMDKYAAIHNVELKIRLLNQFNPAAPRLSVLVVFGMPALIDWFPDTAARSAWDMNGRLGIEEKGLAIWRAGYPCALLPSDFIDNGRITFDAQYHPVVNGHRFDALVFLDPQYAKATTLDFLERYTEHGGKLMLEGKATRDFYGNDVSGQFQKIAARATVNGFDVKQLPKLGARRDRMADGAFMEDGSVVITDFTSWQKNQAKPFTIKLAGHEFSGSYVGVCALKADTAGNVEKFVCGGFSELKRDGQAIFALEQPADTVINRADGGEYNAIIVGSPTNQFKIN